MPLALHKCTLVPKRRRRGEASAELIQGLPEPLESAAWLTAHPHSLSNPVTGDRAKRRSLGRQAGSAPWRRCPHRGALPGPCRVVGTLVTCGCEWFASSQRPGRDVFSFSCAKLFGKERDRGEMMIPSCPFLFPKSPPGLVSFHLPSPPSAGSFQFFQLRLPPHSLFSP